MVMEWWGILLSIALGVGGTRGIIAFVEYGGKKRWHNARGKVDKPTVYQEPFTFLKTNEKKLRYAGEHNDWLVEYQKALNPRDRLIADGYVPGTISTSEARLLEHLYKSDKVQFAQLVKKLNARSYAFPSAESKLLQEINDAWEAAMSKKIAREREVLKFKQRGTEFEVGDW